MRALGGKPGVSTATVNSEYVSEDGSECRWYLDDALRERLFMDGLTGDVDVEVTLSPYTGTTRYGSSPNEWVDTDQTGLVSSYLAAFSEKIGTNGVARQVSDDPPVVQHDATVLVAGQSRWLELTLFQCPGPECGPAALKAARRLAAAQGAT